MLDSFPIHPIGLAGITGSSAAGKTCASQRCIAPPPDARVRRENNPRIESRRQQKSVGRTSSAR